MESTIGARIRQLREEKRLSVADFAKAAGVKPSAVYGLESGQSKPSLETVGALRESFPGLNTEWLQFGVGEMFARTLTPADQLPPAIPSELKPKPAGFPATPGTATPQEADFVGRYITQLEAENQRQAGMIEWLQQQNEQLLGKSPASAYAATPAEPRQEIAGFRTAATLVPSGKVVAMWPAYSEAEAA